MNFTGKEIEAYFSSIDRSGWELVKFGDVAIQKKENVDRENTELTRYIAGEHMDSEDIRIRRWGEVSGDYLGPAFHRKFEKGDILYGSRRTYLRKVAVTHFDGITANTTFIIGANEKVIHKDLLPFLMLSEGFAQHSIKNSKGSVNPYVNWKDIASYEFLLPPKPQQVRLAELLWAAQEVAEGKVELYKRANKLLRSTVKSRCFPNDIEKEAWKEYQIKQTVYDLEVGTSINCHNSEFKPGEIGVLKTSAVTSGRFIPLEAKPVHERDLSNLKISVKKDHILINRKNTVQLVGTAVYVEENYENLFLPDLIWQIKPKESIVLSEYLWYVISSTKLKAKLSSISNGTSTSMVNISQKNFLKLKIELPSLEVQQRVINELKKIQRSIRLVKNSIEESQTLQKSLINQIF